MRKFFLEIKSGDNKIVFYSITMKSIFSPFTGIQLCLLVGIAFIVQSCTQTLYYGPAMLGGESRYQAKPHHTDSSRSKHYVSAGFHHNFKEGYQHDEASRFGTANYHFGLSRKNFSFAGGVGGYFGDYYPKAWDPTYGRKEFWGASATSEFQLNVPLGNDNFKIIGFRQSIFYEGGPYYSFRKEAAQRSSSIINYSERHLLYNSSFTSEYEIKQNAYRFGLYGTFGVNYDDQYFSNTTVSLGGFLYYRRFSGSIQMTASGKQGSNYFIGTSIGF
jgi:hypothetical protein